MSARSHIPYETPTSLIRVLRELGIQRANTPVDQQETVVMETIKPPIVEKNKRKNCEILKIINPYESSFDLIEAGIRRFYEKYGDYPTQLFLNAFRYLTYGMIVKEHKVQCPVVLKIPCFYSGDMKCDVILEKD